MGNEEELMCSQSDELTCMDVKMRIMNKRITDDASPYGLCRRPGNMREIPCCDNLLLDQSESHYCIKSEQHFCKLHYF
ncbi:hypothetical protein GDO78_009845 [Eleutherodactylus coqui]|uniref:Uncharacterized protein n=1 Tax=Eleutherodactylus coqui TaxID=57060 RepID=A0A8J6FAX4_ELECQ|nr:hypothetical protein GDO78_009845 [Eleutherodactylus coqui]